MNRFFSVRASHMKPVLLVAFVPSLFFLLLFGCETSETEEGQKHIATELHREIINNIPEYAQIRTNKVLIGCIHWPQNSADTFSVERFYIRYQGIGSDAPYPVYRLAHYALNACNRERKSRKWKCECQIVDKNDRSVLAVPKSFQGELSPSGIGDEERLRLCLLPDETRVRLKYDDCIAADGIPIAE